MRFNKLDLNLLVVLNALLTERSISRAAEKVHLSQPATSNALARLRDYFGDELLVSAGRQLILTPRAEALIEPVREVLMRIDSTIAAQPQFDPATETRHFTLLASDFTMTVLIPQLLASLYRDAPGIRIHIRAMTENREEVLEQGKADFLICPSQ
jgi:DNA-binding transcriptional LysR family regulator